MSADDYDAGCFCGVILLFMALGFISMTFSAAFWFLTH